MDIFEAQKVMSTIHTRADTVGFFHVFGKDNSVVTWKHYAKGNNSKMQYMHTSWIIMLNG